jgi:hypothetical protein
MSRILICEATSRIAQETALCVEASLQSRNAGMKQRRRRLLSVPAFLCIIAAITSLPRGGGQFPQ